MLLYISMLETEEEKDKFERIYLTYRQRMYKAAYYILRHSEEAEEIVHDSFLEIIDLLERISEKDCHKTWNYIVTIVKNKCFNKLKAQKKMADAPYEEYMENVADQTKRDVIELVMEKEKAEGVAKLLMQLPYPYKEVLYLQYYNQLSGEEISKVLGITPENVRKVASRARKKLEKLMQEKGEEYAK